MNLFCFTREQIYVATHDIDPWRKFLFLELEQHGSVQHHPAQQLRLVRPGILHDGLQVYIYSITHPAWCQCWGSVTFSGGSGSLPLANESGSNSDLTPFFIDFKDTKKIPYFFLITSLQAHDLQSKKLNFLLQFCVKILFCKQCPLNTLRKGKDRDPYVWLTDPGGPKSFGSGSPALQSAWCKRTPIDLQIYARVHNKSSLRMAFFRKIVQS